MAERVLDEMSTEELRIRDWRLDRFTRLGFSEEQAQTLAESPEVDIARVRDMLDKGCPRPIVMRIVL